MEGSIGKSFKSLESYMDDHTKLQEEFNYREVNDI